MNSEKGCHTMIVANGIPMNAEEDCQYPYWKRCELNKAEKEVPTDAKEEIPIDAKKRVPTTTKEELPIDAKTQALKDAVGRSSRNETC